MRASCRRTLHQGRCPGEEVVLEDRPRARARRHRPRRRLRGHRALQAPPRPQHPRRRKEPVGTSMQPTHLLCSSPLPRYPLLLWLPNRHLVMRREKGESFASKLGERSEFVQVDTRDARMLEEALQG